MRKNIKGVQFERWNHAHGCRKWFNVVRDTSNDAIKAVYKSLFIALILVTIIIYLFLGNIRALVVPLIALPVSLISTFLSIYFFDFSINLFTLMALVLAIGIFVDDAIVMLENIVRRIELGDTPLVAA